MMNVADYLKRINYTGSTAPTLENLGAISLAHKIAVPYTGLEIFGGERIILEPERIYKKIVVNKGGGLCYEINWLFMWLLEELGYKVHCGQASFFVPETGKFSEPYFHMLPFIDIGGELYFCDPGWVTMGPMKIKHMVPYAETYAMYRARNIPGKGKTWFFIERHRKTILDSEGNVIKQGPAPPGFPTGYCDEECAKEESSHWAPLFHMSTEPKQLEDFIECNDMHQDKADGRLRTHMLMHRFEPDRFIITAGRGYTVKQNIDPNTDKILVDKEMTSDEEVVKVCRDLYKYEVRHKVNFFSTVVNKKS